MSPDARLPLSDAAGKLRDVIDPEWARQRETQSFVYELTRAMIGEADTEKVRSESSTPDQANGDSDRALEAHGRDSAFNDIIAALQEAAKR